MILIVIFYIWILTSFDFHGSAVVLFIKLKFSTVDNLCADAAKSFSFLFLYEFSRAVNFFLFVSQLPLWSVARFNIYLLLKKKYIKKKSLNSGEFGNTDWNQNKITTIRQVHNNLFYLIFPVFLSVTKYQSRRIQEFTTHLPNYQI